jgi:hypothetical protein
MNPADVVFGNVMARNLHAYVHLHVAPDEVVVFMRPSDLAKLAALREYGNASLAYYGQGDAGNDECLDRLHAALAKVRELMGGAK